jgi:7,8-dihydropterin-6-yl-methyl-4-(beta-D-ribofuranosyl)aminobenzene 5'-phosphate synthase
MIKFFRLSRHKMLTENKFSKYLFYATGEIILVIATTNGFVLISGCGHAGIINTMDQITSDIFDDKVYTAIGGFHLVTATDEHLEWTAGKMKEFGVSQLIGALCTGINALYSLKSLMGLDRSQAVVGSVGDHLDLVNGICAGVIAK